MTESERKELLQDVIDRTLDSYPHSEAFIKDLQDLVSHHNTGKQDKNGIRYYCETKAIADATTKD